MPRLIGSALVLVLASGCAAASSTGSQPAIGPSRAATSAATPTPTVAPTPTPVPTPTPQPLLSMQQFLAEAHPAGTAAAMTAAVAAANTAAPLRADLVTSLNQEVTYCQTGDPKLRGLVPLVQDRQNQCEALLHDVWQAYLSSGTDEWLAAATAAYNYAAQQALGVANVAVQPANSVQLWKAQLDTYLLKEFP